MHPCTSLPNIFLLSLLLCSFFCAYCPEYQTCLRTYPSRTSAHYVKYMCARTCGLLHLELRCSCDFFIIKIELPFVNRRIKISVQNVFLSESLHRAAAAVNVNAHAQAVSAATFTREEHLTLGCSRLF